MNELGWPFDRLLPLTSPPKLRKWEGPVLGLLVACMTIAAGYQYDRLAVADVPGSVEGPVVLVPFSVTVAAFIRVMSDVFGHLPPISFLGRLATGRLLIPKYDVVFVAPFLACVVMFASYLLLAETGLPLYAAIAVGAGLATAILTMAGPDRARWQLTAPARLVPIMKRPEKTHPPLPAAATGR